jgi:hypothetical protein
MLAGAPAPAQTGATPIVVSEGQHFLLGETGCNYDPKKASCKLFSSFFASATLAVFALTAFAAPLLLDDAPAKAAPASPKLICYDCHGPFRDDPFSVQHASVDITCVTCHGESNAHAPRRGQHHAATVDVSARGHRQAVQRVSQGHIQRGVPREILLSRRQACATKTYHVIRFGGTRSRWQ